MRPDPISIRPDLLPPKRDDFMSIGGLEGGGIDYGPGLDGNRQGMPIDPAAGLKPIRPDLLPPKRGDFMSIGGPGGGVPSPINENPGDYMLKDPGAGMIPTPAPGNTNNFGSVDLGGTPSSSILDDFVPPPGYKEPVDSNDSDRFNPIPGLTPKAQPGDFMPRTPEVGLAQPAPIAPPQWT